MYTRHKLIQVGNRLLNTACTVCHFRGRSGCRKRIQNIQTIQDATITVQRRHNSATVLRAVSVGTKRRIAEDYAEQVDLGRFTEVGQLSAAITIDASCQFAVLSLVNEQIVVGISEV